ncbi:MAG: hypothetical protein JWM83_2844 [Candidatus Angelobacter sp.]|nr:hypothetical protein [Candidatus Angelobacter sp.]
MTKAKVTPIIRIVFLFWLVVSIALVGTTIAMLPSPPTGATSVTKGNQVSLLTLTSTVSTAQVRRAPTAFGFKDLPRP